MSSDIPKPEDLIGADAPYTDKVYYVKLQNGGPNTPMIKAIKKDNNNYTVGDTKINIASLDKDYYVYRELGVLEKLRKNVSVGIESIKNPMKSSSGGKKSRISKKSKNKKSKTTKKRKSRRRG
jgi:hypothetical protein